ncbi:MAG: HD domain-containing protein [Oscillospiraceae bacterium]|nr:HD domain-containing protein [Oscillospiraceae bacterium]
MTDSLYFKTDEVSNKFNLRTLLFITVIFIFIWIMNLLGIFINDTQLFWKTGLFIAPIILAACLYFAIAGYGRPEGKYVILIALILAINTTYVFLTYHIILVLLFPLISAALYRSRKVLLITYGINVAAVFVSTPLSYNLGLCDANAVLTTTSTVADFIEKFPSLEPIAGTPVLNLELFYAIPRCLIMIGAIPLLTHITVVIDRQTKKILETQEANLKLSREQHAVQQKIIFSLSSIIESRDQVTGDHIHHTSDYVSFLTDKLCRMGAFKDTLTPEYADLTIRAAPLHDVGKIKVSDAILRKPGPLTPEEYDEIKLHTVYGKDIMADIIGDIRDSEYLGIAVEIAYSHHERYDGKGYPLGLEGEKIPLCARIMAVADVLDALLSKRPYKEPYSLDRTRGIMSEEYGKQFDPVVLAALLENWAEFTELYNSKKAGSDESSHGAA